MNPRSIIGDEHDDHHHHIALREEEEWRMKKEKEEGKRMFLWIIGLDDGLEWIELYGCSVTSCCNTLLWKNGHDDHGAIDFMNCIVFYRLRECVVWFVCV